MNFLKASVYTAALLIQAAFADTPESVQESLRSSDARSGKAAEQLPALVERYAATIGCATQINPENIVRFEQNGQFSGYVALYAVDRGCSGGTAMQRSEIAVLIPGAYNRFFVDQEHSRLADLRPSVIDRIYVKDAQLHYEGRQLKASDALCCPSEKVHGKVRFDDGAWSFSEERPGDV